MRKWRELDNNHIVCHITAGILTTRSTSLGVPYQQTEAHLGYGAQAVAMATSGPQGQGMLTLCFFLLWLLCDFDLQMSAVDTMQTATHPPVLEVKPPKNPTEHPNRQTARWDDCSVSKYVILEPHRKEPK